MKRLAAILIALMPAFAAAQSESHRIGLPLDQELLDIAGLADPNADRILFWDDSADAMTFLTVGSGLSLSGTSLTATGGAGTGSLNAIKENNSAVGDPDIVTLDFLGADFDLSETPDTEINVVIAAAITRDAEWDTSSEIDTAVGDDTGSGALVFGTSPVLTTPNVAGAIALNDLTVGVTGTLDVENGMLVYAYDGTTSIEWTGAVLKIGGTTSSFPALKRSGTALQARLADDSAFTNLEVASEAYNATNWNTDQGAPTKDDVRDQFEALSSVYQPLDADLTDLADGSLTESKIDAAVTRDAEWDTWAKIATAASGTLADAEIVDALTISGGTVDNSVIGGTTPAAGNFTTGSFTGALTLPDNVRQTFNPGANAAGLNVGGQNTDPDTPSDGDIYYDLDSDLLRARINGAWVNLGAGGGGLAETDIDASTELAAIMDDETGSGALAFATSPFLTTPQINDTSSDHQYIFAASELAADRTVTLPLLTGDDAFVFESQLQTIQNKSIVASTIDDCEIGTGTPDIAFFTTASVDDDAYNATTWNALLTVPTKNAVRDQFEALASVYQPLDSDLTTIAGLTATTDNFMVSVASAWASRTPSQVRTTLALVIGTNVQAFDADLDTWATKTAPSGTVVGTTDTQTLTNKRITSRVNSQASTATLTPASDTYDMEILTAQAAALAVDPPSGTPTSGQKLLIRIKDNGTARGITWNAAFRDCGATPPITTVLGKTTYVGFIYNTDDSKWDCIAVSTQP